MVLALQTLTSVKNDHVDVIGTFRDTSKKKVGEAKVWISKNDWKYVTDLTFANIWSMWCSKRTKTLKERSHVTKFSPIFPPIIQSVIRSIYRAELVMDPFAPKFYSIIQSNIGPNFGDGLYFVTCEHSFSHDGLSWELKYK